MSEVTIRTATTEDAGTILQLIKDLALYEKEPESVVCTVDDIVRDGFGEKPLFTCLLAEWEGKAIGMALYFLKWSTWTGKATLHLEDLFVKPEARGKGAGLALLRRLAQLAIDNDWPRFEWVVLDWNKPARDFYHQIGAGHLEGWLPYRLEAEALRKLGEG